MVTSAGTSRGSTLPRRPPTSWYALAIVASLGVAFVVLPGATWAWNAGRVETAGLGVNSVQGQNYTPGWTNVTQFIDTDDLEPSATQQAGITYDPPLQSAVIFGGMDSDGTFLNETWLYISGENEWLGVGMHARQRQRVGTTSVGPPGNGFRHGRRVSRDVWRRAREREPVRWNVGLWRECLGEPLLDEPDTGSFELSGARELPEHDL